MGGKEVYRYATPKSLGYVTLALKAAGSTVRIAPDGAADEANAIQFTALANQANNDTGANRTPKNVLSIVEAEF